MLGARLRFSLLWLSQVSRILADWGLRITAFLELRRLGGNQDSAWYLVTAVFIAPFILLAPFHGCLSNSLPRRWVLVAACLLCLLAVAAFVPGSPLGAVALPGGPWLWALGIMALGSALYSATRYAMLPAVAQDTGLPLTRVNGWIELGGVSASIGGIILGLQVEGSVGPDLPLIVALVLGLNALALVAALLCSFRSDIRRPEAPMKAVGGFFRDARRIFRDSETRASLLALAVFQGVITAGSGAVFTIALNNDVAGRKDALHSLVLVTVGVALGCALAAAQRNTRRSLGLLPLGLTGLVIAQAWIAVANDGGIAPAAPSLLLGLMGGLINVPLRSVYQAAVPADARGNAMSVMNAIIYLMTTAVALVMYGLIQSGALADTRAQMWFLTFVLLAGAALAWRTLLAHVFEMIAEWLLSPMYRIRQSGPGVGCIPARGPVLLIANHTTYFDPFWIAKFSPRQVRPLMISVFYDLPGVRWIMAHVVRAIRVPKAKFRREAPELKEAADELKRGGCVMLFPEAILRRTEDRLLRQFGQGVWHILKEVPQTAVVVFWIEGGWGSYASYKDGRPMKNKRLDFRRRIDIAIEKPQVLPPEMLADHRTTRRYLMRACLGARRHLGLEIPSDAMLAQEEAEDLRAETNAE